jgi:hypothetical protein
MPKGERGLLGYSGDLWLPMEVMLDMVLPFSIRISYFRLNLFPLMSCLRTWEPFGYRIVCKTYYFYSPVIYVLKTNGSYILDYGEIYPIMLFVLVSYTCVQHCFAICCYVSHKQMLNENACW